MATGTIRRYSLFGKLPFMVISVAIRATLVFQRIGENGGFVAGFAWDGLMFIFKLEMGLVMVEIHHSLYIVK